MVDTLRPLVTFDRHLAFQGRAEVRGELGALLRQLAFLGKELAREVSRSALSGLTGYSGGASNATGDVQKKLDVVGNDLTLAALAGTGLVSAVVSEELEGLHLFDDAPEAPFFVAVDPLDGSSNTDNDGSVGTIFGIYPTPRALDAASVLDLVATRPPLAAGYVLYGPATILVYTAGKGVHGFTLDREIGEFVLTHPDIRCPKQGRSYSANTARRAEWRPEIDHFVKHLNEHDPATKRPYSLRYAGALVADLHRALLEGGIYLYPADAKSSGGKLRHLYECAPLAFVVENAGGRSITRHGRTLETRPEHLHHRSELFIGSASDVGLLEQFLAGAPLPSHS